LRSAVSLSGVGRKPRKRERVIQKKDGGLRPEKVLKSGEGACRDCEPEQGKKLLKIKGRKKKGLSVVP